MDTVWKPGQIRKRDTDPNYLIQIIFSPNFAPDFLNFFSLSAFNFLTVRYFMKWSPFRTFISFWKVRNNYLNILSSYFKEEMQYNGKSSCTESL